MLGVSLAGVAPKGTVAWLGFPGLVIAHRPSCLPSLHRFMLPGFLATTKALTAGSACSAASSGPLGETGSAAAYTAFRAGSLCLSCLNFRPFRLQPPHIHFAQLGLSRCKYRLSWPRRSSGQTPRVGRNAVTRSRVRRFLDASPTGLAESSSLSLRTGLSPQVALHLSSRKRSYHFRLQAGNVGLTGTSTPLFKHLHRRTRPPLRGAPRELMFLGGRMSSGDGGWLAVEYPFRPG